VILEGIDILDYGEDFVTCRADYLHVTGEDNSFIRREVRFILQPLIGQIATIMNKWTIIIKTE